ncbi:MAG: YicC family protein [Devosia sp. 67-54]|uniref:YicC/YloC family endoribonuclease n=1 Tax=unclassified Devosia TaxID=196773 RepID=UPI0009618D1F|nr:MULTISPECIES: YicC/YloC family endoribonuclease [unclassified Devosia]OJX18526.1 MAG: YicC family protein [Devosia sp. 67-54]
MASPLASMTGYARAQGGVPGIVFAVEIKSVNARGLDMRMRLTPGYDALEPEIRRRVGKALSRGSVTVNLNIEREGEGGRVVINHAALDAVLGALREVASRIDATPPTLDGILALKGVLEQHDAPLDADAEERLQAAIYEAVDAALGDLRTARQAEGRALEAILMRQIDEIARLRDLAETHPGRGREATLGRLREQVAELSAAGSGLSEDRLLQEALLLATKADIREELDRLAAHVASARALLREGGPAGRKLDFLSQEFNREANTLCSKSNAVELTAIGLDLKAVIDQFREQVQNLE